MDGVMPENLMKNKTQRDEKSSDESEDDYCMNGNNDEEATIVTMYKSHNGTVWSRSSPNSLRGRRCVENIVCVQVGVTRFLNSVDTSTDIFKELLGKNSLLNIQKCTIAEAKRKRNNNSELSIDDLKKAFLSLCIIRGVIKRPDEPLYRFWENLFGRKIISETKVVSPTFAIQLIR